MGTRTTPRRFQSEGIAATAIVTPLTIAESLADDVRAEPALKRFLVSTQPVLVELWLLTAPTDAETERRLYGLSLDLYDRFPDAYFRVHVINPGHIEDGDISGIVPAEARRSPCGRAQLRAPRSSSISRGLTIRTPS